MAKTEKLPFRVAKVLMPHDGYVAKRVPERGFAEMAEKIAAKRETVRFLARGATNQNETKEAREEYLMQLILHVDEIIKLKEEVDL